MDRIILAMIRLKLNVSFQCISVLFNVTSQTCKNYFDFIIPYIAAVLKNCIPWLTKEEIQKNLPLCFKNFKNTRVILDCTEISVQKSKCLKCRILSYSHYKGTNTVKFLIGVAPSGLITFISKAFGGRASDKAIFVNSGLLQLLDPHEDAIMVGKGFLIENECLQNNIKLIRPPLWEKTTS